MPPDSFAEFHRSFVQVLVYIGITGSDGSNNACGLGIKPRPSQGPHSSSTPRRSLPTMQLLKSTIVAILAFAAYATAAKTSGSCAGVGNSCDPNELCCPGLLCSGDQECYLPPPSPPASPPPPPAF
ncbi:hypothetical protein PILCRDRAFT_812288 [Piloderma croceum F 1598]|uniref:Uncharacterized protein n=1 Tax=Piloderma croceum (strain F 1598) TaxID=765440 RepID=A0A0C3CLJ0_PILCF|nr:hypothetical protein PILCRDRAFT_812288 [Piloderma croceum F 1598]